MFAMFTSFMSVGRVPDGWKIAIVTPFYESGLTKSSDVSAYGPISPTSAACKVTKRDVMSDLFTYLRANSLSYLTQSAWLSLWQVCN